MQEPTGPATDGREHILPLVPHLRAYARSLSSGDVHAADDLVQDTILLALRAWHRFTPGTNLRAWLFCILHNRSHTLRGRKRLSAEVGVGDIELYGWVPAVQERQADLRHFKAAFARLSPSHREVLVLYGVHGLPYERIAEITGCKVGSVKSRMNRARSALKAMLLGDEDIRPRPRKRPSGRAEKLTRIRAAYTRPC